MILTGQIDAKHLKAANHNRYEAVLLPEDVQHIKNAQIQKNSLFDLPCDEKIRAISQSLLLIRWDLFTPFYEEERLERIAKGINRFFC